MFAALALWAALAATSATELGEVPPAASPDAGLEPPAPANSFRDRSRFGLDRPSCDAEGCSATEVSVLVGAGGSNFGGFGLGTDLHFAFLAAEDTFLRGRGELDLWGHFNGLGTQASTAPRPPQGELGAEGALGWGYMSTAGLHGGGGPLLLLDALAMNAGVFDGATLVAFTPNVELGYLAHSASFSTGFAASLHVGASGFYGNGALTHVDASGNPSNWAFDPYFAVELRLDLPLSPTAMLRLAGEVSLTPDWVMPGVERSIWAGRFKALVRFGPLITGPMFTFFAPQSQVSGGNSVTGAVPESSFLWMLGF